MTFARKDTAVLARLLTLSVLALIAGCALVPAEPELPPRKETIFAVTASGQLISFNAGQPRRILSRKAVTGLTGGQEILGIDYRVAKGVLFALAATGSAGQLYTIDTATGKATAVGGPLAVPLSGGEFGVDFNPVVDRIRVISNNGQNLRLHPDTGAVVDANANEPGVQTDGALAYAAADRNAGKIPAVAAAAYTYNKTNDKITTNFAIDARHDLLVTQGTREGVAPPVSPNTGQLITVGPIGFGEAVRVSFDIADVSGAAFAAFTKAGATESRFYLIDLATGAGTFIGTIKTGETVRGIAVEP